MHKEPEYLASIPVLKALCDETRMRILAMLKDGERCGCRIHEAFACTQPTISYHMRVLTDAGLVVARREGALTCYALNEAVWPTAEQLLRTLAETGGREEASYAD